MTIHRSSYPPIPESTARKAREIFETDNIYILLGDKLDDLLTGLVPQEKLFLDGQVGETYCRYLLITAVQYREELPDFLLLDALTRRLDIIYALHLPEEYPTVHSEGLCEFRLKLLSDPQELQVFQLFINRLQRLSFFSNTPDARAMLRTIIFASALERVIKAMLLALEELAVAAPYWLREIVRPHWYTRYNHRSPIRCWLDLDGDWLSLPHDIGSDIRYLLEAIDKSPVETVRALPSILRLTVVWEIFSEVIAKDGLLNPSPQWMNAFCSQSVD